MASNDPTDTGGLFIGRRPGTAPIRYRAQPVTASESRQSLDRGLATLLLLGQTLLCLTLWGPQPLAWLWVGSQVNYITGSVSWGIVTAFAGMITTLFLTLMVAKRLDHMWKLVRRAGGYEQKRGSLEIIFIISLMIAGSIFLFWFLIIQGPGPSVAPSN
jgi:hypothetical protein